MVDFYDTGTFSETWGKGLRYFGRCVLQRDMSASEFWLHGYVDAGWFAGMTTNLFGQSLDIKMTLDFLHVCASILILIHNSSRVGLQFGGKFIHWLARLLRGSRSIDSQACGIMKLLCLR